MKVCFLATLSLLAASSSLAQLPYTEKQVIDYAKSVNVKTLDPSLPSQHLDDWLQSGPPHAHKLIWRVQDTCDLKPGTNEDYPLCAEIRVSRNGQWGIFLVQIGTIRKGIVGRPQLYGDIGVVKMRKKEGWTLTGSAGRLSDLPALLN